MSAGGEDYIDENGKPSTVAGGDCRMHCPLSGLHLIYTSYLYLFADNARDHRSIRQPRENEELIPDERLNIMGYDYMLHVAGLLEARS